jgi:hypothetical protein
MFYMKVERWWWAEAVLLIVHILNRIPNTAWPDTSPIEIVTGKKPVLNYLRVFGAKGYVRVDDSKRSKLDAKAHRCMFLGYSETSKAYRVWDCDDERIVVSRSIVLDVRPSATHRDVVYVRDASFPPVHVDLDDDPRTNSTPSIPPRSPTAEDDMEVDQEVEQSIDVEMDGVNGAQPSEDAVPLPLVGGMRFLV